MYIKTRERSGQDQEHCSAPHTTRAVQSFPMGYLGRLNEQMGNGKESCEKRYIVAYFQAGSDKLTPVIKKDIKDIAINIVGLLKPKLTKLKGKKDITIKLNLYIKGYVDVHQGSDPEDHENLDHRRAYEVANELHKQITMRKLIPFIINADYSGEGQFRPRSSKPGKNRRAKICLQGLEVKTKF